MCSTNCKIEMKIADVITIYIYNSLFLLYSVLSDICYYRYTFITICNWGGRNGCSLRLTNAALFEGITIYWGG